MDAFSVTAVKSTEVSWTGVDEPQEAPLLGNWVSPCTSGAITMLDMRQPGWYDAQDRGGEETIFKVTFNLESIKDNWIWLSLSEND